MVCDEEAFQSATVILLERTAGVAPVVDVATSPDLRNLFWELNVVITGGNDVYNFFKKVI